MDKTAAKNFAVLERLARSDRPIGVSEMARMMGIAKSNSHRILMTLVELNYARRSPQGTYTATLRMWELGMLVLGRMERQAPGATGDRGVGQADGRNRSPDHS